MEDQFDNLTAAQPQPTQGLSPSEVDQNNHLDLAKSESIRMHEDNNPTPLKDGQNQLPDSDESNKSKGIKPSEGNTSKIPRGLAGDRVRLKIAANNLCRELSNIKKDIDTFVGWTTDESDSEKAN